ncbi:helix-turn-helix domain-containing protein [Bacillus siamensis]|uniref:helix-turn-helix domain-containing protein n=1 Tax=Bacillus siamensis TaxID=659243 RepID=UPI0018E5B10C|nr:helix-turn-helix domain-containing protein [Bacillus siamensis]QQD80532.1 helix-turn-helix domain-containing protein [Bacillus siamensis]
MAINYFDTVVLDCLDKIDGERTPSAVFHLLKGKKSSQTIQDAGLFQIAKYFGMASQCERGDIADSMHKLAGDSYITAGKEEGTCKVTARGVQKLERSFAERPWPKHCHGANYQTPAVTLWKRLSLLIQVLSNKERQCSQYIPVTNDVQALRWVKRFMRKNRDDKELSVQMHDALFQLLQGVSERQALIFVYSLTSFDRIGKTNKQLASQLNEDEWYVSVQFWGAVHYVIQSLPQCAHPALGELLSDLRAESALTQSARKTLELLEKGFPIERIAAVRNLKTATIEDHIVEISLHQPAFFIEQYISEEDQRMITAFAKQHQTNKIKRIREGMQMRFSYFQIRLALAKTVKQHD